jgi:pyruvate,orthophosphate dikinase
MGKVCVCGASALQIDYAAKTMTVKGQTFREGDYLSINGPSASSIPARSRPRHRKCSGLVEKSLDPKESKTYGLYKQLMDWCSKVTRLQVRTMRTRRSRTENAVAFGATGIGLCRTEHMFFEGQRIDAMREMILAETLKTEERRSRNFCRINAKDFVESSKRLNGYPATIRFPRSATA